jgi:hypothetical protein
VLVDCESLNRGFFECLAEPGDGVAVIDVVEVAFAFAWDGHHIKAGLLAGAGEGDIAPLLQPLAAESEDEGALDGALESRDPAVARGGTPAPCDAGVTRLGQVPGQVCRPDYTRRRPTPWYGFGVTGGFPFAG